MKAALLYAQRFGWRIIPIHSVRPDGGCSCGHMKQADRSCECGAPPGKCKRIHDAGSVAKHPRMLDWVGEASADPATITSWWEQWPDANVGVATGSASGFWVLDVDPRNGGDDTLARFIAQHGPLPATTRAVTGSGGAHYLFKLPGRPVGCGKLGPGLDIKGDGGQIVVAPSRSGAGLYRWAAGCAPWETPPAEAPAWLLALLGSRPARSERPAEDARGYFPPASPEVLDEAREALARHGPAIDGDAGGLHTVHAAAILTHDFALADEEAFPLLLEWNATCVPPWEPEELRERLRRGRKYGKAEYGCRRALDSVAAVRRLVEAWQASADPSAGIQALVEQCRPLAAACGDSVRHALIQQELTRATGLGPKALGLPKPRAEAEQPKQGQIQVTADGMHRVADESLQRIAPHVFARNGVLCEVVRAERTFIHDLDVARISDLMSQTAVYVRNDAQRGLVTQTPPKDAAAYLHSRRSHPGVRVLEAVTSAPVFLADGSILQERGYNAAARVFLEPNVTVEVPDAPTLAHARAAVALFRDLLCDVRFASPADFSSWLAALLSPLVKAATGNAPAPLFIISAASPGSGKSLLAEILAQVVTGAPFELRPYNPKDAGEWGKRLTSYVKAACPYAVFDNQKDRIGDPLLDALITSPTWSDRQLGASDAPPLPNVTTWLATGNNLEPEGDTVRRVLMVRIEALEERPQERSGWRHNLMGGYALEHRAELLSAALTLLRAYHCAGRPDMKLAAWTFGPWGELIRGALVWAGCADPYLTQARASAEFTETDTDAADFWISVVGRTDGTPAAIAMAANNGGAQDVLGAREQLTPYTLRRWLGRYVDKVRGDKRIRKVREGTRVVYRVEVLP